MEARFDSSLDAESAVIERRETSSLRTELLRYAPRNGGR